MSHHIHTIRKTLAVYNCILLLANAWHPSVAIDCTIAANLSLKRGCHLLSPICGCLPLWGDCNPSLSNLFYQLTIVILWFPKMDQDPPEISPCQEIKGMWHFN